MPITFEPKATWFPLYCRANDETVVSNKWFWSHKDVNVFNFATYTRHKHNQKTQGIIKTHTQDTNTRHIHRTQIQDAYTRQKHRHTPTDVKKYLFRKSLFDLQIKPVGKLEPLSSQHQKKKKKKKKKRKKTKQNNNNNKNKRSMNARREIAKKHIEQNSSKLSECFYKTAQLNLESTRLLPSYQ